MNLIGLPVTCRTDSATPPRASPSVLVRMTPVSASASPKARAALTASWPAMLSTTNSVSTGRRRHGCAAPPPSFPSSTCSRPAVSMISTSHSSRRALSTARRAISTGILAGVARAEDGADLAASRSSCRIAAGR
jgi:hypothetical protein